MCMCVYIYMLVCILMYILSSFFFCSFVVAHFSQSSQFNRDSRSGAEMAAENDAEK
jgi:hypothetical protein